MNLVCFSYYMMIKVKYDSSKTFDGDVQWRIQDFPEGRRQFPKWVLTYYFANFFAENCIKMKEFGPFRGRASLAPPWIRH